MPIPDDMIQKLQTFGFSSYQSRTYLALALRGVMTAIEAAKHSKVPKSKVYEVLAALKERGMVEEFPGSPRLYKARPIDYVLESLVQEQEERLAKMKNIAAELGKLSEQVKFHEELYLQKGSVIWTVNGRKAFHEKIAEMISRATAEVKGISYNFSRHPGMEKSIQQAKIRGVVFKGITKITKENKLRILFYSRFATIKNYDGELPLMAVIVDNKECLYRMDYQSDGRTNYVGVHSTNPGLVKTFLHYWNSIWDDSKEIGI